MNRSAPRRRHLLLGAAAALALPGLARAQGGSPPLRVLIGFPPGGATDAIARVVTDRLGAELGQPVVVENRPGAGGRLAADAVLAAPADGRTYMVAPNATPTFQMLIFGHQVKWNIERDFAPVATLASYPLGMGVALATGIELPVTPYKGSPPMVTDLLGGHVPSAVSLMDGMMAHHKVGRIRVIGLFTKERSPLMPEIPTFVEQGFAITGGDAWTGMWARAGTPAAEIERVQRAVQKILNLPEVRQVMTQNLQVLPWYRDSRGMAAMQREDLEIWEPMIKASGFKPES
jgi:tripartite-type tricarboxylate transporter receptor subunit TctC